MRSRRPRRAVLVCVPGLILAAACTGDGEEEPSPEPLFSSSEDPSPSPSEDPAPPDDEPSSTGGDDPDAGSDEAAPVDVTTVPDEITPTYVDAVYDAIIATFAPLMNAVLEEPPQEVPSTPPRTVQTLSQVMGAEARQSFLDLLSSTSVQEDRSAYTGTYVGPSLTDTTVLYAGDDCLVAAARIDFTESGVDRGVTETLAAVSFVRAPEDAPTAWLLTRQLANADESGAPNPDSVLLDADLELLGPLLEQDCTEDDDARP